MARGMPMRPTGGGRSPQPPPRRAAQPAKQPAKQPARQQRAQKPAVSPAQQRQTAQQRQLALQRQVAQQRQATARANQQQRMRQQIYLREAHTERQEAAAVRRTEEVRAQVARLESILRTGLQHPAQIDLDSLKRTVDPPPPFQPGPLAEVAPEPTWEQFAPGLLSGRWGSQSWKQRREAAAREAYERAHKEWEREEQERQERLAAAERAHEERVASQRKAVEQYQERVGRVAAGLWDREPRAVESFLRTVLRRVPLPPEFPRRAEVTHLPADDRVELRMVLPGREVVPGVSGYEYAAGPDEIRPLPRPLSESAELYLRVLAQVVLLVMRDVLDAEPRLTSIAVDGLVAGDEHTSEPPCLVRVRADREAFEALDLDVDLEEPEECLKRLDAQLSPDPYAYRPVPPRSDD